MTAPDDRAPDEQPVAPLHEHNHDGSRGIMHHRHDGQRWHWHVDDGPPGRTAAEAGVTDDLPKYPARFPDEQPAPAGDERTCSRCAHRVHPGCPDCQPAPAAREIPADELAEARRFAETSPHRTAVEARLAAEVRRQAVELGHREHDAARAEVEQLVAARDARLAVVTAEVERLRAELERLRARDEKAKDVVEAWRDPDHDQSDDLRDALDALARAHKDGGQNR